RLSQLSSLLPERTTASDRLEHVPRDRSLALIAALEANLDEATSLHPDGMAIAGTNTTDGLRMTFTDNSIVHLRPSGNAPELRVYVEAQTYDDAKTQLAHALDATKSLLKLA
ncbi:MAG: phosphomannomutase, partial [Pseudomonadota bacterium]